MRSRGIYCWEPEKQLDRKVMAIRLAMICIPQRGEILFVLLKRSVGTCEKSERVGDLPGNQVPATSIDNPLARFDLELTKRDNRFTG